MATAVRESAAPQDPLTRAHQELLDAVAQRATLAEDTVPFVIMKRVSDAGQTFVRHLRALVAQDPGRVRALLIPLLTDHRMQEESYTGRMQDVFLAPLLPQLQGVLGLLALDEAESILLLATRGVSDGIRLNALDRLSSGDPQLVGEVLAQAIAAITQLREVHHCGDALPCQGVPVDARLNAVLTAGIRALGMRDAPAAVRELAALLRSDAPLWLRWEVLKTLQVLTPTPMVRQCFATVARRDPDPAVRQYAAAYRR